jgi:hypothetical protein
MSLNFRAGVDVAPGGSVWVTAEQLKRRLGRRSQFLYDREVVGGEA